MWRSPGATGKMKFSQGMLTAVIVSAWHKKFIFTQENVVFLARQPYYVTVFQAITQDPGSFNLVSSPSPGAVESSDS